MKKSRIKRVAGIGILAFLVVVVGIVAYVKIALPNVAAAPDISVPVTAQTIARGKYLAEHVAVCMDCHSTRDWSKFSGPIVPGTLGQGGEYFGPEMGFPGTFYSRNITSANLGDWTDGEIFRAITTGVDRHGKALFPVMPYGNYGKMAEEDVYAIIAYIRTLPPIENEIPRSNPEFPMNLLLNTIPQEASLQALPNREDDLAYGEYLVNAAACIECHSPVDKGAIIPELAFSGGRTFQMPSGTLTTPNLTPDETGIGHWSKEAFVARFKAFENAQELAQVTPEGYNTIMPWSMYAGMTTSDLEAIYTYLQSLEPIENQVVVYTPR